MSARRCRWLVTALVVGLFSLGMSGCVVPGGGYGYRGNPSYGLGYYAPSGGSYGGWGHGYDVGPVWSGGGYQQHGGGYEQHGGHGYQQHGGAGYQQHGGASYQQHGGAGYQQQGGHERPAGRPVPSLPGGLPGGEVPRTGA